MSKASSFIDLRMISQQIPKPLRSIQRKNNKQFCQVPDNETARLLILKQSRILDSDTNDIEYDRLTALAQRVLQVPFAFLTFIDFDRQWMKSDIGITVETASVDRRDSIDALAMFPTSPEIVFSPDITSDPAYEHFKNPFGLSDSSLSLHFYAGAVISVDGFRLGMLSVVDTSPRPYLSLIDRQNLFDLAAAISNLVKERRHRHLRFRKERANLMLGLNHNLRTPLMSLTLVTEMLRNELKQIALSKAAFIGPLGASTNTTRSPHHHLTCNASSSNFPCVANNMHMEGAANSSVEVSPSIGSKHLFSSAVASTEVGDGYHHTTIPVVSNLHIPRTDSSSSLPQYDSHPDSGAASGTHYGLLSSRRSQSHSTSRQYTPDVPCMNLLGDLQGSLQQLGLLVEMGLVLGKITSGLSVLADGTYDSMLCDVLKVFEKVQTLTQRMGRSQNVLWNIDRKAFVKGKQYSHPDVLMFVLISALTQLLPHSDMIKIKATFIPVEEVTRLIDDTTAARAMAAIADIISPAVVIGRVGILMTELEIFGDTNNLKEIVSKLHVTSNDNENGDKSGGVNSQSDSSSSGDIVDPAPFIDPDVEEFGGSIFALGSLLDNVLGGSSYVMKNHGCVFSFSIPMRIELDSLAPNKKDSDNAPVSALDKKKKRESDNSDDKEISNISKDVPLRQGTISSSVGNRFRAHHTVLPSIPSAVGEDMSENSSMYHQNIAQSVGMDIIDDVDSVDEYDIIADENDDAFLKKVEKSNDSNISNIVVKNECYDGITTNMKLNDDGNESLCETDSRSSGSSSKESAVIYIKGEPILAPPNTPSYYQQLGMGKIKLIKLAELAQKSDPASSANKTASSAGDINNMSLSSNDSSLPRKLSKTETMPDNSSANQGFALPAVQVTAIPKNDIVMSLKDMITGRVPTRDRPLRVLMVDDSLTVQKVMGIWLSKKNCAVTQALNGQVALDLMKSSAFDIVFMDFLMPVMDGLTCMRLYDEFICTAPIPQRPVGYEHQWIIGLSATALESDQDAAFEVNMHMFCAKPVDMQALSYVLEAKRHGLTYEAIRDIASSNRAMNMSTQQKNDASIIMVPDSVDSNLSIDRETMRTKLDNNFNMNIFGSFVFNL